MIRHYVCHDTRHDTRLDTHVTQVCWFAPHVPQVLSAASGTSLGYGFEKQKEAGAGSSSGGGSSSSGAGKKSGGEGGAAGGDGAGAGALTPAAA